MSSLVTKWTVGRHVDAVVPAQGGNLVACTSVLTGSHWVGSVYGLDGKTGSIEDVIEVEVGMADMCSFDEGQFIAACDDGSVRVIHLGNPLPLSGGHNGGATSISFSAKDKLVATGGIDHYVYIWDLKDPTKDPDHFEGHADSVNSVQWGDNLLLTSSSDGTSCVWDVKQKPWNASIALNVGSVAYHASFGKGTERILVSTEMNDILCYDPRHTAKPLWTETSLTGPCRKMAVCPQKNNIIAAATDSPSVLVMNVDTGKPLAKIFNHTDFVRGLAWDTEKLGMLYTGSWDKFVASHMVKFK